MEGIREYLGLRFRWSTRADCDSDTPWEREDGHGPVSGWERREKRPGEMILASNGSSKLFYDFQAAVKQARREGWDTEPYGQGTPGERAHRAAMSDFDHLRRFCNGSWAYCGVEVTLIDEDDEPFGTFEESLWGIQDDDYKYIDEVAEELMEQIAYQFEQVYIKGKKL